WEARHARTVAAAAKRASAVQLESPMDMAWVSRCVGDLVDDQTIVVNEYDLDATQACFKQPGSYFAAPSSGGLGWGLGGPPGGQLGAPAKAGTFRAGGGAASFCGP